MSRKLFKESIETLEAFIENHKPNLDYPALSYRDQDNAINYFQEISKPDVPVTSYYLFASNSMGMTSYAYYKSKEGKIYIIEVFMQKLQGYYNIEDDWHFLKY